MNLDYKIRYLFKKVDPMDYNYSKYVNSVYRSLSMLKLIYQYKNKSRSNNKNSNLENNGYAQINSEQNIFNSIYKQYLELSEKGEFNKAFKNSKKQFLNSYKIDLLNLENHIFLKFLFKNNILDVINSYLGRYFTLNGAYILYSKNEDFESGRSQELHQDGDAMKQLKVFVHLSDVDIHTGPLHVLSKDKSKIIFHDLLNKKLITKRSSKISDDKLEKNFLEEVLPLTGPKGTINIVDTSNCYHYGSRPGTGIREILLFQFVSSFSYRTKFFPNKDLIQKSNQLNNLEINKINNIMKFSDLDSI